MQDFHKFSLDNSLSTVYNVNTETTTDHERTVQNMKNYEERRYAVYARTNRRTKWQYATYCGRWETIERAIKEVKARYSEEVEYRIEDICGEDVLIGTAYMFS